MRTKIFFFLLFAFSILFFGNLSSQMVWNQACQFNGTSASYIAIPNSASINLTGSFTLEAWINPVNSTSPISQTILEKRSGTNLNGYALFLFNGKVAIRSSGFTILVGKTVIQNNQWTHVAGTYNVSGDNFAIVINGSLDTLRSVDFPPAANTDSLLIGKGSTNNPFNGKIDELRIWNEVQIVNSSRRLSLGTSTGRYNSLQLSLTFQNINPSGILFSLNDFSGKNNNGNNRGVTAFDMTNIPGGIISLNECILVSPPYNYVSGPDHPNISPVSGITAEAWLFPVSYNLNENVLSTVIHKGTPNGSRTDYAMKLNLKKFQFYINETLISDLTSSSEIFPLRKWTHIAFTYSGADGFTQFIRNGKIEWDDTNFVGNIHDNTDSLFIGGNLNMQCFDGYIDEVRLTSAALPYGIISNQIFTSVNESNDQSITNVVYNFDGSLSSNTDAGPNLYFKGISEGFSHNAYLNPGLPISPLTNSFNTNFPSGYYLHGSNSRIPETGTSGFMKSDTLYIPMNETINDVNVYVGLNHTDEDDLIISLISPAGTSTTLYSTTSLMDPVDNIISIFDDQADLTLVSNNYLSYIPTIKPINNLNSVLAGTNTQGKWMLKIQDAGTPDTGILIGWGIQFNNLVKRKSILSLEALIQGFYNVSANLMIPDTLRVYIRNSKSPFNKVDSSISVLTDSGKANFIFNSISDGTPVYIQLKHRNSLETWSQNPAVSDFAVYSAKYFSPGTSFLYYKFSDSLNSTFGENSIKVDSLPDRYAIYSGDENQDGTIDVGDIINIYNDVLLGASGYVSTDVNGDDFVDVSDLIITYNNSINIVGVITP